MQKLDLRGCLIDPPEYIIKKRTDGSLNFTVTIAIENIGTEAVTQDFKIWASLPGGNQTIAIADEIAPGANITCFMEMNVIPSYPETIVNMLAEGYKRFYKVTTGGDIGVGNSSIGLAVDIDNSIDEVNEENNYAIHEVMVKLEDIEPLPVPVANFTTDATSGTVPLAVQFTDTSTSTPTAWSWSFGDGATSTEQNPIHTYRAPGIYTISLNASNAYGFSTETKMDYITVLEPPMAAFTANVTAGPAPLTVQFTDTSPDSPSSWLWTFGDSATSTEQHPVHTYTLPGNHTVMLSVDGVTETCTKPGYIKVTPILFGDATEDGEVNQADTLLVLQQVVGLREKHVAGTDEFQKTDVNRNGAIDVGDALFIAQYNVGLRDVWFGVL